MLLMCHVLATLSHFVFTTTPGTYYCPRKAFLPRITPFMRSELGQFGTRALTTLCCLPKVSKTHDERSSEELIFLTGNKLRIALFRVCGNSALQGSCRSTLRKTEREVHILSKYLPSNSTALCLSYLGLCALSVKTGKEQVARAIVHLCPFLSPSSK